MSKIYKHVTSSPSKPLVDLKHKKVLVVEDFFSFRLTVKNMLRSFHIADVDEAANGEEAVKRMAVKRYDIILCDYNLGPGKDGQQVLEEAKCRDLITIGSIFMMITAENTLDMFMGALEYQPDDYLMKPFTKEALEKKLQDLTRKKENLKDIEQAIEKSDYGLVIRLCNERIGKNVKNMAEILKLKGEYLIKKGAYGEAENFYSKVLNMGNLPWAIFGLGRVKFLNGEYDEAIIILKDIISKNNKMMVAYDLLAQVYDKIQNPLEAQQALMKGIQISPKAILRQKALGNMAYKNKDLETAEKAFKETVKQGKYSFFKHPTDYTNLSKVLVENGTPEQALNILLDGTREFAEDNEAALQLSVAECFVYNSMDMQNEAREARDRAVHFAGQIEKESFSQDIELELAKAFFLTGEEGKGAEIVRRLVQSNHEDENTLQQIKSIFKDLKMEEHGMQIVSVAREEVIKLNNEGVKMVREGHLDKAIEYFKTAAERLPENKTINANTAHALIIFMKKFGPSPQLLDDAESYLQCVQKIDPAYGDLAKLQEMLLELRT